MATITTRSGKGSPLTNNEVDANFTNLNNDKLEISAGTASIYLGQSSGTAEATSLASVFDGTSSFGTASPTLQNSKLRNTTTVDAVKFSTLASVDKLQFELTGNNFVFYSIDTSNTWVGQDSTNINVSNVYGFKLPALDGTAGQALTTDGNGVLSFDDAGISTGKAIAMAIVFG
jgi:hypothetical protein